MKLNQKGITLVELIAALALVSIIAVVAWTAMSIGFKHSAVESNKTRLQQDANLIVTSLSNIHRKSDSYNLKFVNEQLVVQTCTDVPVCSPYKQVIDKKYDYTGTTINGTPYSGGAFAEIKVNPEKAHTNLILKLNGKVKVETALTRIITSP
ncbi:type II secretion system protein [Planococcus sp. N028]|uniref:Type II secretion system protein n=1 Tax=Planococcus shixiaomingii TaxID=3058393 RepID=A0ABT8MXH6_9BACL|nr:type II secretion system protein [Planococcus sp. N028]MDN7240345.1 type II secretion system protein [Planococcus sp. N028]